MIHGIFIKTSKIKLVFNMTWLMDILRTASDKILRDKTFNIAKNSKYDGYHRGLASVVYKFFDKKLLEVILPVVLLKAKLYQTSN